MEAAGVKFAGFVYLADGLLLLFEDLKDDVPVHGVVYESYVGNMRGIRIGPLHAVIPADAVKFLLENPRIYVSTVNKAGDVCIGAVLFTLENLDKEAIFDIL